MTDQSPGRPDANGETLRDQRNLVTRADPPPEAIRDFLDAVNALAGENGFILAGLTEFLRTQKSVTRDGLSKQHEQYLIESGAFTAEELAAAQQDVNRGDLQLGAAEAWLSHLCATLSLEQAVGFLGWTEEDVRTAASEGRLHAVVIAGRLHFPDWQFCLAVGSKMLPGLDNVLDALVDRWSWTSISAFMNTPQTSLVAMGRMTPTAWLRDGGDASKVRAIAESGDGW